MWLKIRKMFRSIFSNDRKYRINYIISNISIIKNEDLMSINIKAINNRDGNMITFYNLEKTFEIFKRYIDEQNEECLSLDYACYDTNKITPLITMFYNNGKMRSDYRDVLLNTIKIYDVLIDLDKYYKENKPDLNTDYNCNLFRLYIITMEDIIEKLYTSISKKEY